MKIPFLNLTPQYEQIKEQMNLALEETMQRGDFILGKEEVLFENEFAKYCDRKFCVGVNSGTDALFLGLLSLGIGPEDEIIVPAFTYVATALAVTYTGARPVFVDINEDTYNININGIEAAISKKTKAIIPVHLYGQPAEMKPLLDIARKYNLKIVEDASQAHGARYRMPEDKWQMVGSLGDVGCFSFYPTKNLGAFGDAGAVVTDDESIYKKLLMLRDYGRKSRYEHTVLGYNSRLDTLQAAILRIKLRELDKWNDLRQRKAKIYSDSLKEMKSIVVPYEADYGRHVYHIYAIRVKDRDRIKNELTDEGIGVLVHYPIPLHLQEVYKGLGYKGGDFPVAERISGQVLSLPIYPHIQEEQIKIVVDTLKKIIKHYSATQN